MPYKDPDKRREKAREYSRKNKYWQKNPESSRARSHKARVKVRQEVLSFLGGKCVKCGFSDERALQVDHIAGGGNQEWRKLSTFVRYEMVEQHPERYQLLCANCNWIKRSENKEHYRNQKGTPKP